MRLRVIALLLSLALPVALPGLVMAQAVAISVEIAPPPLPVYEQPPIPAPGYMWMPGYWAWGPAGYFWVPGTWVMPPAVGLLWTPGWWGWADGHYLWHAGYWGPHIGFYGGVVYGFGYDGVGFDGCFWDHGVVRYNRAANNFGGVHITNVYNRTTVRNVTVTRVSYNGGRGGTTARATAQQQAAAQERHAAPTALQIRHERGASSNRALLASENHGQPPIAATPKPGAFGGTGAARTRGAQSAQAPQVSPAPGPNAAPRHEGGSGRDEHRDQGGFPPADFGGGGPGGHGR